MHRSHPVADLLARLLLRVRQPAYDITHVETMLDEARCMQPPSERSGSLIMTADREFILLDPDLFEVMNYVCDTLRARGDLSATQVSALYYRIRHGVHSGRINGQNLRRILVETRIMQPPERASA